MVYLLAVHALMKAFELDLFFRLQMLKRLQNSALVIDFYKHPMHLKPQACPLWFTWEKCSQASV